MDYKFNKSTGALNEVAQVNAPMRQRLAGSEVDQRHSRAGTTLMDSMSGAPTLSVQSRFGGGDPPRGSGARSSDRAPSRPYAPETTRMRWTYFSVVVEDGQRALIVEKDGTMWIAQGPMRVARRSGREIRAMEHHAAHPGEFLLVRYRDGRQEHLAGPADLWADPRVHQSIERDDLKRHTAQLSETATYRQLHERAAQCGYRIAKVVYRGYGASESLQQMHDQAIEARTRLEFEKATEAQAQDIEDDKLERTMGRAAKERAEGERAQAASLTRERERVAVEIERTLERARAARADAAEAAASQRAIDGERDRQVQAHLAALMGLGVDLTRYLTQARADRLIEVRGAAASHLHLHGEGATGQGAPA